jgi:hypothetical protein
MSPAERDDREAGQEAADADSDPRPDTAGTQADDASTSGDRPRRQMSEQQLQAVLNVFYGLVDAPGATFGVGAASAVPGRRLDGKLTSDETEQALRRFVPPETYRDAESALRKDHLIELVGPEGVGKRASAICLLSGVADGELFVVAPTVSLQELAKRKYTAGNGYAVIDRQAEDYDVETEVNWRAVRDRVLGASAYLVVTTTLDDRRQRGEPVRRFAWQPPDLRRLMEAHAQGTGTERSEAIDQVLAAVPGDVAMTNAVELACQIATGAEPRDALQALDRASLEHVRLWFDEKRSRQEILEVTVLAFLTGSSERSFDVALGRLDRMLARHMPPSDPPEQAGDADDTLPQRRKARVTETGLISFDRVRTRTTTRRVLAFKRPGYRKRVVAELWDRFDAAFWDAARKWLDEMIKEQDVLQIANGLALLAEVDLDEVMASYLERWSGGELGWVGQEAATYVIWHMCHVDALAPVALGTAVRWANTGDVARRWTAAVVLSGEVGVRYPSEAARRLWQLMTQDDDLNDEARVALATLFAALVGGANGAETILEALERRLRQFNRRGGDERLRGLTLRAALAVLSVRDTRSGCPAVTVFMRDRPQRAHVLARLWAGALRHRGSRREALIALWHAVAALQRLSSDPRDDAGALGEALAKALPLDEHAGLKKDLSVIQAQLPNAASDALAQALVAALEPIHSRMITEEKWPRIIRS